MDENYKSRIEKWIGVEKGPKRTLGKKTVDGMDIYSHSNGINIYEGNDEKIFEYIKKNNGKIIEEGDSIIFQL